MTARTFGRKGIAGGEAAAPPRRAAPVAPASAAIDEKALQLEVPPAEPVFVPTDRSLTTAYALWLCAGLAGAHRFYLRRPLTGALQAVLFLGCWAAAVAEYYAAFGGLALSGAWMVVDGFLIRRLHRRAGAR